MIGSTVHQIHFSLVTSPQLSEQIQGFKLWMSPTCIQDCKWLDVHQILITVSKCGFKSKLKLGYVKDKGD